jgi:hypothetical protein
VGLSEHRIAEWWRVLDAVGLEVVTAMAERGSNLPRLQRTGTVGRLVLTVVVNVTKHTLALVTMCAKPG